MTKYLEEHTEKLKTIPAKTWKKKGWETFVIAPAALGLAYFIETKDLLADFQVWKLDQNALVVLLILFAGYSAAGDIIRGLVGFAVAAAKDIKGIFGK